VIDSNTPDTSAYLWLWIVIFAVLAAIYLGSLWFRFRELKRDAQLMAELEQHSTSKPEQSPKTPY
jgi:hypothetical protein